MKPFTVIPNLQSHNYEAMELVARYLEFEASEYGDEGCRDLCAAADIVRKYAQPPIYDPNPTARPGMSEHP